MRAVTLLVAASAVAVASTLFVPYGGEAYASSFAYNFDYSFRGPLDVASNSTHTFVLDGTGNNAKKVIIFDERGSFVSEFDVSAQARVLTVTHDKVFVMTDYNALNFNFSLFERLEVYDHSGKQLFVYPKIGQKMDETPRGYFNDVLGMDSNGTHVFVTDTHRDYVTVLDATTNNEDKIRSSAGILSHSSLRDPHAVAANTNHVFVTDTAGDMVHIFDVGTGSHVSSFGSTGTDPGQFQNPTGIAVNREHIMVMDSERKDVQLFDLSGKYAGAFNHAGAGQLHDPTGITTVGFHTFVADTGGGDAVRAFVNYPYAFTGDTVKGDGDGQFQRIQSIATNSENIFVLDVERKDVQVFDGNGTYVSTIGGPGTGDGQLQSPVSVAANSEFVFVLDSHQKKEIHKFRTDGEYVESFGQKGRGDKDFRSPSYIAANSTHVFVTDGLKDKVMIFDTDGEYVESFGVKGTGNGQLSNPSAVATNSAHILVADRSRDVVLVYDSSGIFVDEFDGPGDDVYFGSVRGMASGPMHTFTVDAPNHRVSVFDLSGEYVSERQVTGTGLDPFGDPYDIVIHDKYVLVADRDLPYVVKIDRLMLLDTTPPSFTSAAVLTFAEGGTNEHKFTADEDGVTFAILTHNVTGTPLPSIEQDTLSWTPSDSHGGDTYNVTVRATDPSDNHGIQHLMITVLDTNTPPVLGEIMVPAAPISAELVIELSATDVDIPEDTLTFAHNHTSGEIRSTGDLTAVFAWTPTPADADVHVIRFSVSDGEYTDFEDVKVRVSDSTAFFAYNLNDTFSDPRDVDSNSTHVFVMDRSNQRIKIYDAQGQPASSFITGAGMISFAVTSDKVFVAFPVSGIENQFGVKYQQIRIYNHSGTKLSEFEGGFVQKGHSPPDGAFQQIRRMSANDAHLFVTDTYQIDVQVFNHNGGFVGTLAHNSLGSPNAVTATSAHVFVTDALADRVHIFDAGTRSHVSSFGSTGTGPGQFDNPAGIAANPVHIMVMDSGRDDVQMFDLSGRYAGAFTHTGAGQLHDPTGITTVGFHTFVADTGGGDAVRVFDNYPYAFAGDIVKGDGDGQFKKIRSVATNSENVFVLDAERKDVQVLDGNGNYVSKIGGPGTGDGSFTVPVSVAANSEFVFVADSNRDDVQIFDTDGTFVGKFGGRHGTDPGKFQSPAYIAANSTHVFVTDVRRDDVQIFYANGTFISKFGDKGVGHGQLQYPSAVAANSTHILVADRDRDVVLVFDSSGRFVSEFGKQGRGDGAFEDVRGMAPGSPHMFMVDSENHRVSVFAPSGIFGTQYGGEGTGLDPFGDPYDIVIHDKYVLVADRDLPYVAKIDLSEFAFDTTPPTLVISDITVGATDIETTVNLGFPSISDEYGGPYVVTHNVTGAHEVATAAVNASFRVGTHVIQWSATDSSGNRGTAEQRVTVSDTTPPYDLRLKGDDPVSIHIGTPYTDAGIYCFDTFDLSPMTTDNSSLIDASVAGTYRIAYSCQDASGNEAEQQVFRTVIVLGTPAAPAGLTTSPGNAQVVLSWTEPDDGGSPVTGYMVEYSSDGGTSWSAFGDGTGTATSVTVTGLTNGQQYEFRVSATNAVGMGPASGTVSATPDAPDTVTRPGPPTGLAATPDNAQVVLSWSAGNDGGSPVTGYVVEYSSDGGTSWSTFGDGTGTATSVTVTGLTNGQQYEFRVSATNAEGTGPASGTESATPRGPPGAPTGLTVTPGNAQVVLSWTEPDDGGSPITDYVIATRTTGSWIIYTDGTGTGTNATVTNLENGVNRSFYVYAINEAGRGPISTIVYATPRTVPAAPAGLAASPGDAQVVLSWTEPGSDGGSPVTGYTVEQRSGSAAAWELSAVSPVTVTNATVTGLTNGQQYEFRVNATNAAGTGPASDAVPATPRTVPAAPAGLAASPGDAQVVLSWTEPGSDGGSPVTGYTVEQRSGSAAAWELSAVSPVTVTNATVTGLTNGQQYEFRVNATNAAGTGPASDAVPATPRTVPAAPAGLAASPGDAQVVLSWTEPDDGGSPVTGYMVEYSSDGGTSWSPFGNGTVTATSVTVTGLTNGQQYEFRVNATNAAGTGPASGTASATPRPAPDKVTPPGPPTGLAATPDNAQVMLSWSAGNTGGSPITDYTIEYSSDSGITWKVFPTSGILLFVTVTSLENGVDYQFRVNATNAAGTGPASNTASATPRTVPAAPTGLTASPGDAQVVLSWTEPDDGGSPVTGYTVEQRSGSAAWATSAVSPVTVTDATVTGLTNGQQYEFRVNATNAAGTGPASNTASATPSAPATPDTAPPVISLNNPSLVRVEAGGTYVEPGAVCSDDRDPDKAATVGGATVDPDTIGTYEVTYNCSDAANNPAAQVTRTVQVSDTTIPVITLNGNSAVSVPRGTSYADAGASCDDTFDSSPALTDNSNAIDTSATGTYQVTYSCQDASGNQAAQVSRTVSVFTTPGAPTGLTASHGNAQVVLSWSAPGSDGGSPVTGYTVEQRSGSAAWATSAVSPVTVTDATVTGLTNGQQYEFRVNATNAAGTGPASNTASATPSAPATPDTAPPVISLNNPSLVRVEAGGTYVEPGAVCSDDRDPDKAATVGGATVDPDTIGTYEVTYNCSDAANNPAAQVTRTVQVSDTTIPVITLNGNSAVSVPRGTSYADAGASCDDTFDSSPALTDNSNAIDTSATGTYQVTYSCQDASGNQAAQVSRTVSVFTTPGAPTGLTASHGNAQVVLSWSAPGSDGGSPVTGYTVEQRSGSAAWATSAVSPVTVTDATVTGLTNGQQYEFRVNATNAAGTGPASNTASATPSAPATPDTAPPVISLNNPSLVRVEAGGTYVEPGAVCSDDRDPDKAATVGGATVDPDTIGTYEVTYNCSDAANNPAAQVTRTVQVSDTTIPVITLNGNSAVSVPRGTSYADAGASCDDTFDSSPALTDNSNAIDTSATGTYQVTYSCQDASGNQAAQVSRTVSVFTTPGAPTGLTASHGNAQVVLSWSAPGSDGGSPVTGYTVEQRSGSAAWATSAVSPVTVTDATVTGLTNGQQYEFRVNATNAAGTGPASNTASATPSAPVVITHPGPPTGLSAVSVDGGAALSWTAPADDGGSAITDYIIHFRVVGGTSWIVYVDGSGTATTVTVTGLVNGLMYDFRVSATNVAGTGHVSNTSSATPVSPYPVPPVPDDLNRAAVSFTSPSGGDPLRGTITLERPANKTMKFAAEIRECVVDLGNVGNIPLRSADMCGGDAHASLDPNDAGRDFSRNVIWTDSNKNTVSHYVIPTYRTITLEKGQQTADVTWQTHNDGTSNEQSFTVAVQPLTGGPVYGHHWVNPDRPPAGTFMSQYHWKAQINAEPELIMVAGSPTNVTEGTELRVVVRATPTADPALTFNYHISDPRSDTNPNGFVNNNAEGDRTHTVRGESNVRVQTHNDNQDERDGTITVSLRDGPGYSVGTPHTVIFTVRDNDPGPLDGTGNNPQPPTTVSIGLAGGGSEGDPVSFGIGASPAPQSPLPVNVTLSGAGNVLNASDAGWRIVEIPPIGSYTLDVQTIDDGVIDVNNVTLTINPGAGYTPGQFASWTVDVQDAGTGQDMVQPPVYNKLTQAQNLTAVDIDPALIANVTAMASQVQHGADHVDRWNRVLAAFGETAHDNPMTAAEARDNAEKYSSTLWPLIADVLMLLAVAAEQESLHDQQKPAVDPELVANVTAMASQVQHGADHVDRWNRVLAALGEITHDNPMTAAEAQTNAEKYSSPLWPHIAKVLTHLESR